MADDELELDVNEKKGGSKTIILVVVGILLLNGIGLGVWLFLSGDDKESSSNDDEKEVVLKPLIYLTLVPEFIVNFGPGSKVRYLQVDLQISTRDEASLDIVNTYRPVLRNDILVLLSGVSFDQLKSRSGKETLQKKLLDSINKVVNEAMHPPSAEEDESSDKSENGHSDKNEIAKGPIENVYFSSFIMQ